MDRRRLEAAAAEHAHLRGLLGVPLGALLIIAAGGNWEWGPLRHTWLVLACAAVAAAATLPILRYYNETLGRITASTRMQATTAAATVGMVALVLGVSSLVRSEADWSLDLPVNGLAASLGAGFLTYSLVTVGPRAHHLMVWGALIVAGLLPVWGALDLTDTSNAGLVLAGLAAMVSGVLDHRLLTRSSGRTSPADEGAGAVGA